MQLLPVLIPSPRGHAFLFISPILRHYQAPEWFMVVVKESGRDYTQMYGPHPLMSSCHSFFPAFLLSALCSMMSEESFWPRAKSKTILSQKVTSHMNPFLSRTEITNMQAKLQKSQYLGSRDIQVLPGMHKTLSHLRGRGN